MDLLFLFKIGQELENWFSKLGRVYFLNEDHQYLARSDATLAPHHFLMSIISSRGLFLCSQPIRFLDIGVSLGSDPSVNPPFYLCRLSHI